MLKTSGAERKLPLLGNAAAASSTAVDCGFILTAAFAKWPSARRLPLRLQMVLWPGW